MENSPAIALEQTSAMRGGSASSHLGSITQTMVEATPIGSLLQEKTGLILARSDEKVQQR